MQYIGAADDTDAPGLASQAGLLGAEIRIVRIYGPNNFPLKIHNDFQARPAGRTDGPGHGLIRKCKMEGRAILETGMLIGNEV
jgi:hypothetical protein